MPLHVIHIAPGEYFQNKGQSNDCLNVLTVGNSVHAKV